MKVFSTSKLAMALVASLALFPEIASAAVDAFTIYAYGSGNVLRQIFEGMKGFVDDPGYRMLILLLLLLTMIFVLARGYVFNRPSPVPIVGLIATAFAVQILLFSDSARAPVHIEDQVHGEDYLVDDMPLILAGAAALTSEMSRYMVKLVEAFYMGPIVPPEMMISNNNTYNFANKIMSALKDVTISEPLTKATFNSYMRDCVVPEMYQGRIRLDVLLNAPPEEFWDAARANNLARMSGCFQRCDGLADGDACPAAECPNPFAGTAASGVTPTAKDWRSGMMVSCPAGHTALGDRMTTMIGATAFNQLGNTMLRDTSILDGVISSTVTHVTGVTGASGTEHFVRAGMMNMFRESSANVIANGGGEGLIQVLGSEQAKAVQRTNWMVAAGVFAESVAYLWSALQAFIFAIFPIAIVLFMFPGLGPKAMAGYFGLLAWISLWMPFLAIINFLSISWLLEDIRQLAMVPLSYGSLLPISEAGANMQAVTNFLGTMVPVLTYGMVRGGEFALTQFASDASAPKASEKSAAEIAGKSYSYGSISANNVGMNKFDSATSMSMGYDAVTSKDGAGAVQMLTPQSGAAESIFGAAQTQQSTYSKSAQDSKIGAMAVSAGENFAIENGSASSFAAAAKQVASTMTGDSNAKSSMAQKGSELREAQQAQIAQQLAYQSQASQEAGSKLSTDITGKQITDGAIVAGAITGTMLAETARVGMGGKDQRDEIFANRLKEDFGSVEAGLKAMGVTGPASQDAKAAREYLAGLNADAAAIEEAGGGNMDGNSVARARTLAGLAGADESTLEKLASSEGGASWFSKETKDSLVAFGAEAKQAMKDGAAGAAGALGGIGAGALSYITNVGGEANPLKNLMSVNGSLIQSGGSSTTLSTDNGTSTTSGSTEGNTSSRLLGMSSSYMESNSRVRTATDSVATSIEAVASNTNNLSKKDGANGGRVFSATGQTSAADSVAITSTTTSGSIDARAAGGVRGEIQGNSQNAVAVLGGMSAKAGGAMDAAQKKYDEVKDKVGVVDKGMPDAPAPVTVGDDAMAQAKSGQGQSEGQVGSANEIGAPKAAGSNVTGARPMLNQAMSSTGDALSGFARTNGDLIDKLANNATDTSRYARGMNLRGADAMGVTAAVTEANAAAGATLAAILSGNTVNKELERFPGMGQDPTVTNVGTYYNASDSTTGASFKMVPSRSDGQDSVILAGDRKGVGEFLTGPNAGSVVADPSVYKDMSPAQAEQEYNRRNRDRIGEAEMQFARRS